MVLQLKMTQNKDERTRDEKSTPSRAPKANSGLARKAERLKVDIEELEHFLFSIHAKDPRLRYEYLKDFRIEIVRSFIINLHLATEDLLHAILFDFLARQNRRLTKKETIRIVDNMRSADLIHWCRRLNLVTPLQYTNLLELNRVRNACAHNWVFDLSQSQKTGMSTGTKRHKAPAVLYKGHNIFSGRSAIDDFHGVFSSLYLKLLFRVWKIQGKV